MRYIVIIILLLISHDLFSQKQIRDKASEAQEKRQVYKEWGDWRPKAKRVLGVPTNPAYWTVWSWTQKNNRYRRGKDIRPLKSDGEENQRNLLNMQLKNTAKKLREETDKQKELNLKEYAHITSLTSQGDPLYLLYYKKRLKNLIEIRAYLPFLLEYFSRFENFSNAQQQTIEDMYDEFQVLQDKLEVSHSSDMDRGKRFLNYHEIMLDLRKLERKMGSYSHNQIRLKEIRTKTNRRMNSINLTEMNDRERFRQMILNNPDFN